MNYEIAWEKFANSDIEVANFTSGNPATGTFETCVSDVTDTGWYQCSKGLVGTHLRLKRTTNSIDKYTISAIRAYKGINVVKWA